MQDPKYRNPALFGFASVRFHESLAELSLSSGKEILRGDVSLCLAATAYASKDAFLPPPPTGNEGP